ITAGRAVAHWCAVAHRRIVVGRRVVRWVVRGCRIDHGRSAGYHRERERRSDELAWDETLWRKWHRDRATDSQGRAPDDGTTAERARKWHRERATDSEGSDPGDRATVVKFLSPLGKRRARRSRDSLRAGETGSHDRRTHHLRVS